MKSYIWYDNNLKILGFISNSYSTLEDVRDCFNFENSQIIETNKEVPQNYENYKLVIADGEVVGFEEVL